MRVRIHTVEQVTPGSKGKTARVASGSVAIKARAGRTRKNEEVKWLEIKATGSHEAGTGQRGGEWKVYTDSLTLQIYPEELKGILNAAIANGLVDVPGYEYLLEARSNLENAITEMSVSKRESSDQKKPR